jgi:hypothetical protein
MVGFFLLFSSCCNVVGAFIVAWSMRRVYKRWLSQQAIKAVWLRNRPHDGYAMVDRVEVLVQLEDPVGKRTWHVVIEESAEQFNSTIDHVAYSHAFAKKPVDTWLDGSDDDEAS